MRHALGSLTLRGRAFLASGLTAAVCGLALLERDLTRMGLLVAVLPLLAALFVVRRSHHLVVHRHPSTELASIGDPVRVDVEVENAGPPTGVLLLEEDLALDLGGSPRFVLRGLGRSERSRLEYSLTPTARGRHRLGPMSVRRREPFGMVEVQQQLTGHESLLVLPRVLPLPALRLTGGRYTTGDETPRSYTIGSVADVVVREYRRGDDLRRVHWRSTARTGELMVRNEEQLWQARATVVLDSRRRSHRGRGADSSLETAVVAAASAASHLTGLGYQVRLVTAEGVTDSLAERGSAPDATPILEALAVVDLSDADTLPVLDTGEDTSAGVVVGVLGADEEHDRTWWAGLTARGAQGLGLCLDVDDWAPGGRASAAGPPAWLLERGWRAARLERRTSLATAWQGLDA